MKKEPRRCLKCQSMGSNHLAAECDQTAVCGTCGLEHRTVECTESDQRKYWCANCNLHGHASWDRTCPKFIECSKRLEQLNPESTYTYFPTNEPWTWEQMRTPDASGRATSDTNKVNGNDRGIPLERQGHFPQSCTKKHPSEQTAPPTRQAPNREHRPEPPDIEWHARPGRQRRIDEFAPAPHEPNRQSETNPPRG